MLRRAPESAGSYVLIMIRMMNMSGGMIPAPALKCSTPRRHVWKGGDGLLTHESVNLTNFACGFMPPVIFHVHVVDERSPFYQKWTLPDGSCVHGANFANHGGISIGVSGQDR